MSMDEMLLQELYGSEEVQAEEQIKQAQVELVEAVAAEAGVDLNELSDDELEKFAHYVLSDEDEEEVKEAGMADYQGAMSRMAGKATGKGPQKMQALMSSMAGQKGGKAIAQDVAGATALMGTAYGAKKLLSRGKKKKEMDQEKMAEADLMGRQMARSYMDELQTLNGEDSMNNDTMSKVASAMEEVANAWNLEKQAAHQAITEQNQTNEQEKLASALVENGYEALALAELYTPEEFAKEAEFRAAEILAANGVHPETFEDIEPQEVKIASFPGVEDASNDDEAQYLEHYNNALDRAALHIIESLFDGDEE